MGSVPSLGTSICGRCGHIKKKKERNISEQQNSRANDLLCICGGWSVVVAYMRGPLVDEKFLYLDYINAKIVVVIL